MIRAALLALLAATPAAAQSLRGCDTWEAGAQFLVTPASEGVRDFARGAVTLIHLDTFGEPVCCSSHLLVVHPGGPDEPFPSCTLVSREGTLGWADLDLPAATARYDPATGLDIDLPTRIFDQSDGTDTTRPGTLRLRIDQAAGTVATR